MRYVLPGQPGSRVKVDRRYENFIGGRGLADADRALDPLPGATDASGDAPGTARVELFTA